MRGDKSVPYRYHCHRVWRADERAFPFKALHVPTFCHLLIENELPSSK